MIEAESVLTIPWATVAAIVSPIVGGGVFVVRWIINRSDKDREALESRMDADRKVLTESLTVLKEFVGRTSNEVEVNRGVIKQMMDTQVRIAASQDRIALHLERISAIIEAGDRQAFAHKER